MRKWIFRISILFNVVFIFGWLFNWFNSPSYKLGRLERTIEIGYLGGDSVIFKLPKGLTVRNVSERGIGAIGQFENERFEIVITSENNLVNYELPKDSLGNFGNYYSADMKKEAGLETK